MKSIGKKLALQIAIALILTMTLFGVIDVYQRNMKFSELFHDKVERVMQQLTLLLGDLLFAMNNEQIERVVQSYMTDSDILAIRVWEGDTLLKSFGKPLDTGEIIDLLQQDAPELEYHDGLLREEPITYAKETLGRFEVVFSPQFIENQMRDAFVKVGANLLLIILIETLVVVTLANRKISRPLLHIARAARQIAAGDIDIHLPSFRSQDEIGVLATAFETMVIYIQRMANIALNISEGNLPDKVQPQSQKDVLGNAFLTMSAYLQEIAAVATHIASGDLRKKIIPKTEQDILGTAFQKMGALRQSMSDIMESADQVREASEELSNISTQMAALTEETSLRANILSNSSEQISENVDAVAVSTEEFSANIREVSKNTINVAQVAGSAVQLADSATETIAELEARSQEIGEVISVITAITQQTNLLALNATIEAARAGESGKGFSVVATEIKDLSRETAASAEDIIHKLEAIQSSSRNVREAINEVGSIIMQIHDLSDSIASGIEQQSMTTQEIATRMAGAAKGSQEIFHVTGEVATAVQKTSNGAASIQNAAVKLTNLADRLQQLVGTFQI